MSEHDATIETDDYRNAPSGIGPLAAQWRDKPHRLVYDLCREVERLRAENDSLRSRLGAASDMMAGLREQNRTSPRP